MSDNPQYGTPADFALPELAVVELRGRDALAFAQSQFMNDVTTLDDGRWQWNGWLDPKGRVQALFALLRRDATTLWIVTASDASALAASLRRVVFRSKVVIDVLPVHGAGRFAAPLQAKGTLAATLGDDVEFDLSGDAGVRMLRIHADAAPVDERAARAWWALDVRHGWPGVPGARLDAWTPQQLSLERFPAFSVRKGCYPGQEIVARTHFLGRAKRELALFEAADAVVGDALRGPADASGTVVAVAGGWMLAVVPRERESGDWSSDRAQHVERPIAPGLERG